MANEMQDAMGYCPQCGGTDCSFDHQRCLWFACSVHKTKWMVIAGSRGEFSHDRDEELRIYFAKGFDKYKEVAPIHVEGGPNASRARP